MPFVYPTDPATEYAQRVTRGDVIAGPHVRNACKRHLDDLIAGPARGLTWDIDAVEDVITFFRLVLTVEIEYLEDGELVSEAIPFEVHESQAFVLGSLFGWKKDGVRRFRRAYIEIGKGNGKSPLAAGIGMYMLIAMGKLRAEVYSAATDKDQAAILFRDAVEMYRRSPDLAGALIPSGETPVWQLTYPRKSSFFKPISSEKKGKSGIRPYCGLIDEVHEHPNDDVIEMLRAGTKMNSEALIFEITNSGSSRESVCWSEHEYSIKVCTGEEINDSWFAYVCALDVEERDENDQIIREADDPFADEKCWVKANPLLGVSIQPAFIREQVTEAKGMPSKEARVRRLHFCQWTDGEEAWITRAVYIKTERELQIEDFYGAVCYGGLDLSYTRDLSAFALAFPTWIQASRRRRPQKPKLELDVFVWFWKPRGGLDQAVKDDRVRYDVWHDQGHLFLTEGQVIRLEPIAQFMGECASRHDLRAVAYDNYRHRELADDMSDLGIHDIPMTEHPQGFRRDPGTSLWMPNSVQELENAIVETRIRFRKNPLLQYNVASVVIRNDPAGTDNKIFDKRKSRARIDGIVAAAMAVGTAAARHQPVFKGLSLEDITTPEGA